MHITLIIIIVACVNVAL